MRIKHFCIKLTATRHHTQPLMLSDFTKEDDKINDFMKDKRIISVETKLFTSKRMDYDENYALITILYEEYGCTDR